jgi:hypothetical protein
MTEEIKMVEVIPQFSPYSYVKIDSSGLIYAENVLFSTIVQVAKDKNILKGELTQDRIYSVPKEEFQSYRTPQWNRTTGITTYNSKSDESYLIVDDKGFIVKCWGLNIGSLFTRMTNWVSKERLRLPYCKDVGELLASCIQLLEVGKVPYPGMTIYRNEDTFVVKIPPFNKEEVSPSIPEVSTILRKWLEGVANRHIFLKYHQSNKGLSFFYSLD